MSATSLEIRVDDERLSLLASRAANMPTLIQPALEAGMTAIGIGMVARLKAEALSGQILGVRTGNTRRAAFSRVGGGLAPGQAFVLVGVDRSKAPGIAANEFGADIRPKAAANLTIPLDAARTGKGVAKFSARDVIANPSNYGFVRTFFRNHILFGVGLRKKITPLFVLKKEVIIPERAPIRTTVVANLAWASDLISKAVSNGLRVIFTGGA